MISNYNVYETLTSEHAVDDNVLLLPNEQEVMHMYHASIQKLVDGVQKRMIEFELGLQPFRETAGNIEWKVFKDNFLLDGIAPRTVIDDMNCRIGVMLYPVYIHTDTQGMLMHIIPGTAIKARWEGLQEELSMIYKGKNFETIAASVDETLNDQLSLKKMYARDLLLRLLFMGVYGTYKEDWSKEDNVLLPVGEHDTENVNMQMRYHLLSTQNKVVITGRNSSKNATTTDVHMEGYILLDEVSNMLSVMEMNIIVAQQTISIKINSLREQ